jgi:L-glutamine-phosphate cytidylyltransferase
MDAVILAAGRGSRLNEGRPKCLVEIGGRPLIHHQLDALRSAGIERVTVVVGYQGGDVCHALPDGTRVVFNDRYAETNSLYSFMLARPDVGDDVLVLNADVLFHPVIPRVLVGWNGSVLAYDSSSGDDAEHMKVEIRGGALTAMSKELPADRTAGENVGMIRLSGDLAAATFDAGAAILAAGHERDWLASAVDIAAVGHRLHCLDVRGLPWTEIDFPEDLEHARSKVLPAIAASEVKETPLRLVHAA